MKMQSNLSQPDIRTDGATPAPYISEPVKNSGIANEYHSLLADIEDLIKSTTSLTGEDLVHAKEVINARILAAKKSVEEVGSAIADKAKKSAAATNSYVHENPWQSIGIGAALGLIVGVVVARRK